MKIDKGFTLLEILIVVVIIGILAGLAIPKFNKTIETAKGKEAYVTLETLRTAERMYYLDNNGQYTPGLGVGTTGGDWDKLVTAYLPENPNANPNRNWDYGFATLPSYVNAWGNCIASRKGGKYGYGIHSTPYVGMYLNGDMKSDGQCAWPWPPD